MTTNKTRNHKELGKPGKNGKHFIKLIDNVGGAFFTINSERIIEYVSESIVKIMGFSPSEITGKNFGEFVHAEDLIMVSADFEKTISGELGALEYRIKHKNGRYIWVRSYSRTISEDDNISGISGLLIDITESKIAQQQLEQSSKNVQEFFDTIDYFVFVIDTEGKIIQANKKVYDRLHFTDLELRGKPITFLHPRERSREVEKALSNAGPERTAILKTPLLDRDHAEIPVETTISPGDWNGETVYYFLSRDITDEISAQKMIELKSMELDTFFKYTMDLLCIADTDGYFRKVNPEWEATLGYEISEIENKRFIDFVHPDDVDRTLEAVSQLSKQKEILNFSNRYRCKDGTYKWIEWRSFPSGKVIYAVARDITRRQKTDAERTELIKQLESKNRELMHFAYTVSHDLKSPLLTIAGFIDLMEKHIEEKNYANIDEFFTRIKLAAKKMETLLSDLLQLSRVGQMVTTAVDVSLELLVKEAIDILSLKIEEKGIKVILGDRLPKVYGDPKRLSQVMQNLIENSIKFMGDCSEPVINIDCAEKDGETVCFIRDNGIGIDEKNHEKVFNIFSKLDPESPGTGIGLAIVKRIIDIHGGKIWIESEGEKTGTTIYFQLPGKQRKVFSAN